jgi:hypothetical protein
MDTSVVSTWLHGSDALANSTAEAVVTHYRDTLADLWNVHDLHVGPDGYGDGGCVAGNSGIDLSGAALVGAPSVNSHYARHAQGFSLLRAVAGMHWNAPEGRLSLAPPVLNVGDALPILLPGGTIMLLEALPAGNLTIGSEHTCDKDVTARIRVMAGSVKITSVHVTLPGHSGNIYGVRVYATDSVLAAGDEISHADFEWQCS